MPELPEVETIARNLRLGTDETPALIGETISSGVVLWDRSLQFPSPTEFSQNIVGQRIEAISRRGKYLLLFLAGTTLLFHLRMSGDLLVETADKPIAPHHRLVLNLESGRRLAFNDPRKFGRAWLTPNPEMVLGKLGPEPLDEQFTAADLFQRLHRKHRQLKPLLLDQTFLAGIGNIYGDEALYLAQLHPLMLSDSLSYEQAAALWSGIRQVLREGIQRNGASIDWVYRGGEFQNYFMVYQRTGEACYRCGTPIRRIEVGQRGTHFCPSCQVLPDTNSIITSSG
jgi:formamidopyrimidine-DNA glycosylase